MMPALPCPAPAWPGEDRQLGFTPDCAKTAEQHCKGSGGPSGLGSVRPEELSLFL